MSYIEALEAKMNELIERADHVESAMKRAKTKAEAIEAAKVYEKYAKDFNDAEAMMMEFF